MPVPYYHLDLLILDSQSLDFLTIFYSLSNLIQYHDSKKMYMLMTPNLIS